MNLSMEFIHTKGSVGVLKLTGTLDAANYLEVIKLVKEKYLTGVCDLLIDLNGVTFMSSSGIFALHSIALIMRGGLPPDPEYGWSAFHTAEHFVEAGNGFEKHVKFLNPLPRVQKTLETTNFNRVFEVYTDQTTALSSF